MNCKDYRNPSVYLCNLNTHPSMSPKHKQNEILRCSDRSNTTSHLHAHPDPLLLPIPSSHVPSSSLPLYYPKTLGKVAVEELKDLIGTTLKDPRPEKPRKNSQNTEEQGPVVTPLISLQVLLPQTKNTVHLITEESGLAVERKVLGSRLVEASL